MERYSDEIVSSMTEAVRSAAQQAEARSVVLVGYSGGGVLAC
jgi:predicted esterase